MKPFPRALTEVVRRQRGLVTATQLVDHRIVGRRRTEALQAGTIVTVHRGVYRFGTHPVTFEQRCLGALLAAPSAVIAGPTAGRLYGLRKVATEDIHVISRSTVFLEDIHAHKTDLLDRSDRRIIDGLRVLAPTRLLCDLAWHLDDAALESVLEQMLQRRLLTVPAARAQARRFRTRGRPGSRRLGRTLERRPEWLRPVDSDLELRLWRALRARGVMLERQVPVQLDGGETIRLDLASPALRLAIEVDHVTWHGGRLETQADKRRDREMSRLGWVVSRVTDHDIEHLLPETLDQLVAIVGQRSRDPAA